MIAETWNNWPDWVKLIIVYWGFIAPILFMITLLIPGAKKEANQ